MITSRQIFLGLLAGFMLFQVLGGAQSMTPQSGVFKGKSLSQWTHTGRKMTVHHYGMPLLASIRVSSGIISADDPPPEDDPENPTVPFDYH
ncbi:MAG: hypothetical protein K2X01_10800 [Cyanobacteria bacterium]|nr:hypothetical protein [Cyanobacteriota bacterium]